MSDQSVGKDWVEVLVAIGRIEEGIKGLRESIERLEKKSDAQDNEIQEMQLEIQQLKTQRSTVRENLAVAISIIAATTAIAAVVIR
jgi:septal ring factor EnvC (AmiA/AmiB activator)